MRLVNEAWFENYCIQFQDNSYTEPNSLAYLKFMDKKTVQSTFQVEKKGHMKKLMKGIKYLQYPDSSKFATSCDVETIYRGPQIHSMTKSCW